MHRKRILFGFLVLILCLPFSGNSQSTQRPKIGLTLSGGGAKGLGHIGILKAIDSAGLKIDYVTGTSMGSIVGSLYAAGYSADQLETIARSLDWDVLLSNSSSLRSLIMEEKTEYGKYAVELPWVDHKFLLPSGIIESEELWIKFNELFFPVYNIKDFTKFPIPFKCIAADIGSGEAIVLDKGEIVTAIRSSMAIPSVFTAVEDQGHKMVDGGIVRNFPVKDVRRMGADIVIGSNVSSGLLSREKVSNALQVLLQVAFFKEAADTKEEIRLCDIYIPVPVEQYSFSSFNKATEIIDTGIAEGRRLYPVFKRLADSLNALYGEQALPESRLPVVDSVQISDAVIEGLQHTSEAFFLHMMGFENNRYYTAEKLSRMVRKVFGTRYYNRVLYKLEPMDDGTTRIVFTVDENPRSFAKLGLHYNNFSGISVISNFTTRNFLFKHSRSYFTASIGELMHFRGEHLQYLGRGKNVAAIVGLQYEYLDITVFSDFKKSNVYRNHLYKSELKLQYSSNRRFTFGSGIRYEWVRLDPSISTSLILKGNNDFLTGFLYWKINTLDRPVVPRKGIRLEAEGGLVFRQDPDIKVYASGQELNQDSLGIRFNNYQRISLNYESYTPLGGRTTFISMLQAGVNLKYDQNIFNEYIVGGLTHMFRNQILFAGLEEGSFYTSSVAALQLGIRVNLSNSIYTSFSTNGLVKEFLDKKDQLKKPDFLSGHALTIGYNSGIGPLELSVMYCDQSKRLASYINFGIPF